MELELSQFWHLFKIPKPVAEYKFHPKRRWRFDWAWPSSKIAVEIEGGIWISGRHSRGIGYSKDMEKYNQATLLGWKVFRFTPQQFKNGEAAELLENIFL